MEFEKFYLINVYTPNAGENLKRLGYRVKEWDRDFWKFINNLKDKPIMVAGDLNVAHTDLDVYEMSSNKEKFPSLSVEERESFEKNLDKYDLIDTYRDMHPKGRKYSYWLTLRPGMKAANKGWRLDYFVVRADNLGMVT
jgi:hypothetical protein